MIVKGGKGTRSLCIADFSSKHSCKSYSFGPCSHLFYDWESCFANSFLYRTLLKSPIKMGGGDLNLRSMIAVPPCLTHRSVLFGSQKNWLWMWLALFPGAPSKCSQLPTPFCQPCSECAPPSSRLSPLSHTSHLFLGKRTETVKISQGSSALVPRLYSPSFYNLIWPW